MSSDVKYFFIVSFTVDSQAGLAIVIAETASVAFINLKNSGLYNGTPEKYVLVASQNVGSYFGESYGLMLESYTNALVAYDALVSLGNSLVGPKGDKGDTGEKGDKGDTGPSISVNIGTVTQTEIGTSPTVTKTQVGTDVTLDFTFPMYDISAASKAQLESDLKTYIDGLFAAQATALTEWKAGVISDLNDWKAGVVGGIAQYEANITSALEDNERVIANALVRHELELSN